MNPNMPFTSSPDPSPSQNPLSLMMSQMSKYAMPSSTPLYHNAIKTIATSDDELLPDRPMLPPGSMSGTYLQGGWPFGGMRDVAVHRSDGLDELEESSFTLEAGKSKLCSLFCSKTRSLSPRLGGLVVVSRARCLHEQGSGSAQL